MKFYYPCDDQIKTQCHYMTLNFVNANPKLFPLSLFFSLSSFQFVSVQFSSTFSFSFSVFFLFLFFFFFFFFITRRLYAPCFFDCTRIICVICSVRTRCLMYHITSHFLSCIFSRILFLVGHSPSHHPQFIPCRQIYSRFLVNSFIQVSIQHHTKSTIPQNSTIR